MTYTFCTYFDRNYLNRALALYISLRRCCRSFRLYAVCLDDASQHLLRTLELPGIHPVSLSELESYDSELRATKAFRSRIEYYFTCTASILRYLLETRPELPSIAYLDADLFFYSEPGSIYTEIGEHSIAIIPHGFSERLKRREVYGIYNVGFLYFRNDAAARECLEWWRQRCIEWCYDRLEDDRFADQKYLDRWPELFRNLCVLTHRGANLAPWNLDRHVIRRNQGRVMVADDPLVFFHFHGLKRLNYHVYDLHLDVYRQQATPLVREEIFKPYVATLHRISCRLQPLLQRTDPVVDLRYGSEGLPAGERLYRVVDRILRHVIMAVRRNFVLTFGNRLY